MNANQASIHCPQCGAPNEPDNQFCNGCGARLSGADAAKAPVQGSPKRPQPTGSQPSPHPSTGLPLPQKSNPAYTGAATPQPAVQPSPSPQRASSAETAPTQPHVPPQPVPVVSPKPSSGSNEAWNPTAIAWISFFFSFIPAGVMCALNYERLGHPERKWKCLLGVMVGAVIYIWLMSQLVLLPWRATSGLSFINLLVSLTFHSRQKEMFERHLQNGGKKAPVGVPVALSLLWMLVFAGGLGGWAHMAETRTQAQVDKIAQASDSLANQSTQRAQQFDRLEQQLASQNFTLGSQKLNQHIQKQIKLLDEGAALMRQAAGKLQEVDGLNITPEFKKFAGLIVQSRRKHAEAMDVLRERAQVLLKPGTQSVEALDKKRAQLDQRAQSLFNEADALQKQADQALKENS